MSDYRPEIGASSTAPKTQEHFTAYDSFDPTSAMDHIGFANYIIQALQTYDLQKQNTIVTSIIDGLTLSREKSINAMEKELQLIKEMLKQLKKD